MALFLAASVPDSVFSASPKKTVDCENVASIERECALKNPMEYIDSAKTIDKKVWAKEYWVAAYKKNTQAVLAESKKFADQPFYREVVLGAFWWASQHDPSAVFLFSSLTENEDSPHDTALLDRICKDQPALKNRILAIAAHNLVRLDPIWAIAHCGDLSGFEGVDMGALLNEAVGREPSAVYYLRDRVYYCKLASPMFLKSVQTDQKLALKSPEVLFEYAWSREELFDAMRNNPKLALENLSKFRGWDGYRSFLSELTNLLYTKHRRYLSENIDLLPNGLEKEMLIMRLRAEIDR